MTSEPAATVVTSGPRGVVAGGKPGRVELAEVVRAVLPVPQPGERYHVRGLTELWLDGLARKSVHTHRSYRLGLLGWLDYCWRADIDPLAARRADVDDWVSHALAGRGPQTINARLSAVKSWYRYLISNGLDDELGLRNPADHVDRPERHQGTTETTWLDTAGLNALLEEANRRLARAQRAAREAGTPKLPGSAPDEAALRCEVAARDLAVLRVLATTAVRSAAVQEATVADVRGWAGGHRVLTYHPKAKDRTVRVQVALPPMAAAAVDHYLQLRATRVGIDIDALTGPAFATTPYHGKHGNGPISTHALINMIRKVAAAAGLPAAVAEKLVVHSVRHSSATLAARLRLPHEVQAFLNHVSPDTTAVYTHADTNLSNSVAYTIAGQLDDTPVGDEGLLIKTALRSTPIETSIRVGERGQSLEPGC